MRRMIRTDDGDTPVVDSLAQSLPVMLTLNGGITLDAGAKQVVVVITEIKMTHRRLSGDTSNIEH